MPRTDVTQMPFSKLYPLLVNKAEKKGRTRAEVDQVTAWLTGYTAEDLARLEKSDTSYGDFFRSAPKLNPNRTLITGKICGVRVEEIEDPLMREIRYLDKLVDELAQGKPMENPWRRFTETDRPQMKKNLLYRIAILLAAVGLLLLLAVIGSGAAYPDLRFRIGAPLGLSLIFASLLLLFICWV